MSTSAATDPVLAQMQAEIVIMTGPEADALYRELKETLVRKLGEDPHAGSHAAALGAAVRLVLSLIHDVGASEGQRNRLKALAVGMLRADWDSDRRSAQ
jgi:hypothetical protein